VKLGRRVLFDARHTSGHGDSACASCHIFADFDSLAWDLGDPTGTVVPNPNPFRTGSGAPFHPLKGPMTTQSLRGLAGAGPMHWRGDRTGGSIGEDPLDAELAFMAFNVAFEGLLGRESELPEAEMQAFTDFILTVRYPPNPIRALDDTPTAAEAAGESFFRNTPVDGGQRCRDCHALPLGTDGQSSIEGEPQEFKIPHLRNMYQKVGMFGVPPGALAGTDSGFLGDQVRGFGFLHDGSVDSVFDFLHASVFNFSGTSANQNRRNLEAFVMAFDTGLAPVVGQQVTLSSGPVDADAEERLDLLIARDDAGDCELIVRGVVGGEARGARHVAGGRFRTDRASDPRVTKETLLFGLATGTSSAQTYTCVPPGTGTRSAIDRDEDGVLDRDEADAGTDPGDPTSFPGSPEVVTVQTTKMQMKDASGAVPNPDRRKFLFKSATRSDPAANRVVAPAFGSEGDPTLGGGTLRVYSSNGSGEQFTADLPASLWSRAGSSGYRFKGSSGAVKIIKLKGDQIVIKGGKSDWGYTLDEPSQGRITVRLTLGDGIEWCAEATPPSSEDDRLNLFSAARTAAPASCPVPPAG
jgi:hypothetical protein